ncbi:hypothetical protein ACIQI7_25890 [Kitasatospora sp. NPDC092039]|uniref:hypothetical protein n=1 Tax=Kitasatospora sp. NPDC092039 TaxID=3364086 RepID=UPI0038051497
MSGQYPGQFGPPPGGTPYGPGHPPGTLPGARPGAAAVGGQAAIPGRFGVTARVLCTAAPLLTFGLLGAVPSLLLAVRRRRAYDIAGAVVFCALLLAMIVSAGVAGTLKNPTADTTGSVTLAVLWLLPPAHFLLMDSRAVWLAGPPAPSAAPRAVPPYAAPNVPPYAATVPGYGAPSPTAPTAPTAPVAPLPATPPPAPPPHETDHDLRELGELLRRQAREDRP